MLIKYSFVLFYLLVHTSTCLQVPFVSTSIQDTLTLHSVYHRASKSSVHAGAFRRLDITAEQQHTLKMVKRPTFRPKQELVDELMAARKAGRFVRWSTVQTPHIFSTEPEERLVPDITDQPSVLALAEMSFNAYTELGKSGDWYDLGSKWRVNNSFGWETDGLRGHVFSNNDKSLLIVSIKGTSAAIFNGEPTGEKDKLNDNILFSCCCGKVGRGWSSVCPCNDKKEAYVCESACIEDSILNKELYYDHAIDMYLDLYKRYPDAEIWVTGHSLGGALASLLGQTFGLPTVTFESPGDNLASKRLHLPHPPGAIDMPIWHFGHTADPLFIGVCTGPLSGCYYAGFIMESRCHAGKVCVWDTVKDNGWKVNLATHRIGSVIEDIIKKPNEFPLPDCKVQDDCEDCGLWTFKDDRDLALPSFHVSNNYTLRR